MNASIDGEPIAWYNILDRFTHSVCREVYQILFSSMICIISVLVIIFFCCLLYFELVKFFRSSIELGYFVAQMYHKGIFNIWVMGNTVFFHKVCKPKKCWQLHLDQTTLHKILEQRPFGCILLSQNLYAILKICSSHQYPPPYQGCKIDSMWILVKSDHILHWFMFIVIREIYLHPTPGWSGAIACASSIWFYTPIILIIPLALFCLQYCSAHLIAHRGNKLALDHASTCSKPSITQ